MQKSWFLPLIFILSACTQQASKNTPPTVDSNDPRVLVNISELVSSGGFTLENKDVVGSGFLGSTGIDLGQFSPPSRTDRVLVLTNNTSQPQALSEVSLSFNNQNFVIRTNRCTNSNLGVGKSCEISISFILHNEYNGIKTDLLKVKKGTDIFSIPLKAEIINHPPDVVGAPQIEVIFEEPFFTLPFSSSNLFKQVIVKNTSYNEIAPSSYLNVVLNDPNNQYAIRYNQCSVDLPPQGSCIISVYNNRIRVLRQENLLADKTANLLIAGKNYSLFSGNSSLPPSCGSTNPLYSSTNCNPPVESNLRLHLISDAQTKLPATFDAYPLSFLRNQDVTVQVVVKINENNPLNHDLTILQKRGDFNLWVENSTGRLYFYNYGGENLPNPFAWSGSHSGGYNWYYSDPGARFTGINLKDGRSHLITLVYKPRTDLQYWFSNQVKYGDHACGFLGLSRCDDYRTDNHYYLASRGSYIDIDGVRVLDFEATSGDSIFGNGYGMEPLYFGYARAGSFDGIVSEALIYSGEQSSGDQLSMLSYFQSKYFLNQIHDEAYPVSCLDAKNKNAFNLIGNHGDGVYIINPQNGMGETQVYCDQTTDGGGWTLVMKGRSNSAAQDYNNLWYAQAGDYQLSSQLDPNTSFKFNDTMINSLKTSRIRIDYTGMSPLYFSNLCEYHHNVTPPELSACTTGYSEVDLINISQQATSGTCPWHYGITTFSCGGSTDAIVTSHSVGGAAWGSTVGNNSDFNFFVR